MADVFKSLSLFSIIDGTVYPTFGSRPLPILGFDKLYTEVLKYFITEEGSDILDKTIGTQLLTLLGLGGDEIYVAEVIDAALDKTRTFFYNKATEASLAGTPLSNAESLLTFDLISFKIENDVLSINVVIANKLGETKVVNLEV